MAYIDADDVRRASGIPSTLMTDAVIDLAIAVVEPEVERLLNCKVTGTEVIEARDGNGKTIMFTEKNPLLALRELIIDDDTMDLDYVKTYRPSGKMILMSGAGTTTYKSEEQSTIIRYIHGFLEESTTGTTLSTASTAGTSVALSVASETGFSDEDWVEVYGTDGNREAAQISGTPGTGSITVDELALGHASASKVVLLQVPPIIKRLMEIECALYVAINAIGATYVFNASYSLGELGVVKGVPYTHWQSSVEKLLKERTNLIGNNKDIPGRLKPRPHVVV